MKIVLTKTSKLTILLAVIFIIALGSLLYWRGIIKDSVIEIKEEKKIYSQEVENAQSIVAIKKKTEELKEVEAFFDGLYIKKDDIVSFIQVIESVTRDAGVTSEIRGVDSNTEGKVKMNLSVSGTWKSVNSLILMLENLPYHISINSMTMRSGDSSWRVEMTLVGVSK